MPPRTRGGKAEQRREKADVDFDASKAGKAENDYRAKMLGEMDHWLAALAESGDTLSVGEHPSIAFGLGEGNDRTAVASLADVWTANANVAARVVTQYARVLYFEGAPENDLAAVIHGVQDKKPE